MSNIYVTNSTHNYVQYLCDAISFRIEMLHVVVVFVCCCGCVKYECFHGANYLLILF